MDEMSTGQVLERSFAKDTPHSASKSMVSQVVSAPDERHAPAQVKPQPKAKPQEEKRFTIEPLSRDANSSLESENSVNTLSLQHLLLLKHFGIGSHPTPDEVQKLKTIWEYAKAESADKTIAAIIRLRNKLGTPTLGESPLDRVFRHIRLRRIHQYEKQV